jgi:murein DD-endopeptidase MepM/ murein hydrolase activator NlpD
VSYHISSQLKYILLIAASVVLGLFFAILTYPAKTGPPLRLSASVEWNRYSYWQSPWGSSPVHKGIDLFAGRHTPVLAPASGWVLSSGYSNNGGNHLYILGSGWKVYYLAHLDSSYAQTNDFVQTGQVIGTVGNTGNASGKACHLHYSIFSMLPHVWKYDEFAVLGHQKMFYLNPADYLEN